MVHRVRVWGWGVATAAALVGLEVLLAAATRAQAQRVLAPGPASVDEAVGLVAATVAVLLGAWLAASTTAAVLSHAPGRLGSVAGRLAAAWAPLLTRRVAAALVGATLGGTLAPATALAAGTSPFPGFTAAAGSTGSVGRTSPPSVDRVQPGPSAPPAGWTPTRPVQRPVASPVLVTSGGAPTEGSEVVVHRGDSLWRIAADHLGPDATDAEIADAWPRWHTVNRDVIGDDPDHLLPGQVLRVPTTEVAR